MGYDQYLEEIIYIPFRSDQENPRQTIRAIYADRGSSEPTEHVITDAVHIAKRVFYWRNIYGIDEFLRDATGDENPHHHYFDGDILVQLRDYLQEYLDTGKKTEEDGEYEEYIRETYRKTIEFIGSVKDINNRSYEYWAW